MKDFLFGLVSGVGLTAMVSIGYLGERINNAPTLTHVITLTNVTRWTEVIFKTTTNYVTNTIEVRNIHEITNYHDVTNYGVTWQYMITNWVTNYPTTNYYLYLTNATQGINANTN